MNPVNFVDPWGEIIEIGNSLKEAEAFIDLIKFGINTTEWTSIGFVEGSGANGLKKGKFYLTIKEASNVENLTEVLKRLRLLTISREIYIVLNSTDRAKFLKIEGGKIKTSEYNLKVDVGGGLCGIYEMNQANCLPGLPFSDVKNASEVNFVKSAPKGIRVITLFHELLLHGWQEYKKEKPKGYAEAHKDQSLIENEVIINLLGNATKDISKVKKRWKNLIMEYKKELEKYQLGPDEVKKMIEELTRKNQYYFWIK